MVFSVRSFSVTAQTGRLETERKQGVLADNLQGIYRDCSTANIPQSQVIPDWQTADILFLKPLSISIRENFFCLDDYGHTRVNHLLKEKIKLF